MKSEIHVEIVNEVCSAVITCRLLWPTGSVRLICLLIEPC